MLRTRQFPKAMGGSTTALVLFASLLGPTSPCQGEEPSKPSILFIIADDWSYPHAGVYGDRVVRTPNFDRFASEGMLFTRAFCASPSCTPSRGAILTGQAIHQLESGGNLWSALPARFAAYPDLLEKAGYKVAHQGKGWGPGSLEGSGRTRNPAGPNSKSFAEFLSDLPADTPFCYWYGSVDPHRPYELGSGKASGLDPGQVQVPGFLPDVPEVRSDILDYYDEVRQYDEQVGSLLKALEASGRAENTLVVVTSDNGMPFPRAKANLYDAGTRMPLAIRWPRHVEPGSSCEALVGFTDFAPTFLEAAGLPVPDTMTGKSLMPLLKGSKEPLHEAIFIERERHANVRKGDLSYPMRAIRTDDYLYIWNPRPDRWPAGDPVMYFAVGPYGDVDGSPSKDFILEQQNSGRIAPYYRLAFAKRPEEELYNLRNDPYQLHDLSRSPDYNPVRGRLRRLLENWMRQTGDPRVNGGGDEWDKYRYFGAPVRL